MKLRGNEVLRERLAASYVLGTLKGGARRRFEGLMHDDGALRRTTHEWNQRLGAMAEFVPAQQPPAQVWHAIERRLDLRPAGRWAAWRNGALTFWRTLALTSSAVAALLLLNVTADRDQAPAVSDVATLTDEQAQTALVVTADRERNLLRVRVLAAAPLTQQQVLQLWAVGRDGQPRSLGLLDKGRELTLPLAAEAVGDQVAMLAVSLEPAGGSPDPKGPSGPILYKGSWVNLM
ncbi:anti-sigma factor [Massilia niabensis]|uniref:Anti-sigma factor domain-containing protein n=1 Tax=Massilia niabensis TaxID=544910 RepID=A0ABW0L6G1_9BURK